jgi:hypothetical protein
MLSMGGAGMTDILKLPVPAVAEPVVAQMTISAAIRIKPGIVDCLLNMHDLPVIEWHD